MSAKHRSVCNGLVFIVLSGAACLWTGQRAWAQLVRQNIYSLCARVSLFPYSALTQDTNGDFYFTLPSCTDFPYGAVYGVTLAGVIKSVMPYPGSTVN